jgi:hypothetical protein
MKRQTRIDDVTWKLFVRACGGRCCECGADGKMHQGHILRHADGGQLVFQNLIPLCKSCNAKHSKGFTRDSRPVDWRDAFFKLFMAENGIALGGQPHKPGANHIEAGQNAESAGFVDLESVKFVPKSRYITTCEGTPSAQPMSEKEARDLIWELFEKSKQCAIRPKRPLLKRQDQMQLLAIRNGRDVFWIAGDEFLRESPCPWVAGDEDRGGYAQADSWQHLCESFDGYVKDGEARRLRDAEQAARKKVQAANDAAADIVYVREQRWNDYIRIASISWPEMSAEDGAFISAVTLEKAAASGVAQDVSEDRFQQSLAVWRRAANYTRDALRDAKQKLYDALEVAALWAKRSGDEDQKTFGEQIQYYRDWIDQVKSLGVLNAGAHAVYELRDSLDPNAAELARKGIEDLFGPSF